MRSSLLALLSHLTTMVLSFPVTTQSGISEQRRQQPTYYDGYAYPTVDTFSIDLWELQGQQGVITAHGNNLLNISTSYGGTPHHFNCSAARHTDPGNPSQWIVYHSPKVPSSNPAQPILQSNIRLFPGNMCSGAKIGSHSFDGTLLEYAGDRLTVGSDGSCDRYTKVGGRVSSKGPIARCVFPLTPT